MFGKSTTAELKGSDRFEAIKYELNKGDFSKTSIQWVAENLAKARPNRVDVVQGLRWCRQEIEKLLPAYDNLVSLSSLLDPETRDDHVDNVIQWHEIYNEGLEVDKRLGRSIAAWGKVKHRIEKELQPPSNHQQQRHGQRGEGSEVDDDHAQDQEIYQQLLNWATNDLRGRVVSEEYLNSPETWKCQPAFLYKPTFTEHALKRIANKLVDDGTDWVDTFGQLRRKIDHEFPGHGISLKKIEDVEPRKRKGVVDLWNTAEEKINAMDLRGSQANDFRRALAIIARDVQKLYGELQKLQGVYESLKVGQKGGV